jgi:hypothetical protein
MSTFSTTMDASGDIVNLANKKILDISIKQTVGYELHCIPFASDLIAMLGYLHGDIERRNKEYDTIRPVQ